MRLDVIETIHTHIRVDVVEGKKNTPRVVPLQILQVGRSEETTEEEKDLGQKNFLLITCQLTTFDAEECVHQQTHTWLPIGGVIGGCGNCEQN